MKLYQYLFAHNNVTHKNVHMLLIYHEKIEIFDMITIKIIDMQKNTYGKKTDLFSQKMLKASIMIVFGYPNQT